MAGGWATSDRRQRLPKDWPRRRAEVMHRDHGCCQVKGPACVLTAVDVDHIIRGDDHRLVNLQAICEPCHRAKTYDERRLPPRRRPPEPHPGMIGG